MSPGAISLVDGIVSIHASAEHSFLLYFRLCTVDLLVVMNKLRYAFLKIARHRKYILALQFTKMFKDAGLMKGKALTSKGNNTLVLRVIIIYKETYVIDI